MQGDNEVVCGLLRGHTLQEEKSARIQVGLRRDTDRRFPRRATEETFKSRKCLHRNMLGKKLLKQEIAWFMAEISSIE